MYAHPPSLLEALPCSLFVPARPGLHRIGGEPPCYTRGGPIRRTKCDPTPFDGRESRPAVAAATDPVLPVFGSAPQLDPKRRSEEPTSALPSIMLLTYDVFCLKKKQHTKQLKLK